MAKSTRKKFTPLEKVQRSLDAAAKILNKKIHQPNLVEAVNLLEAAPVHNFEKTVLFQVWCESEQRVIGTPSTDRAAQQILSTRHDQRFGHTSKVLST